LETEWSHWSSLMRSYLSTVYSLRSRS
jgi:hypothetical protein